ncbi:MAG: hypothetical protein WC254_05590 [Candidatus Woesearchaeota archaeon]|jgi:hypothetical protein
MQRPQQCCIAGIAVQNGRKNQSNLHIWRITTKKDKGYSEETDTFIEELKHVLCQKKFCLS